jgi:hypothetical protein
MATAKAGAFGSVGTSINPFNLSTNSCNVVQPRSGKDKTVIVDFSGVI